MYISPYIQTRGSATRCLWSSILPPLLPCARHAFEVRRGILYKSQPAEKETRAGAGGVRPWWGAGCAWGRSALRAAGRRVAPASPPPWSHFGWGGGRARSHGASQKPVHVFVFAFVFFFLKKPPLYLYIYLYIYNIYMWCSHEPGLRLTTYGAQGEEGLGVQGGPHRGSGGSLGRLYRWNS